MGGWIQAMPEGTRRLHWVNLALARTLAMLEEGNRFTVLVTFDDGHKVAIAKGTQEDMTKLHGTLIESLTKQ
jgi:hypothetical protein